MFCKFINDLKLFIRIKIIYNDLLEFIKLFIFVYKIILLEFINYF